MSTLFISDLEKHNFYLIESSFCGVSSLVLVYRIHISGLMSYHSHDCTVSALINYSLLYKFGHHLLSEHLIFLEVFIEILGVHFRSKLFIIKFIIFLYHQ